jgi:hypothetical protein
MGDIADMMLEGILDEETGEYLGDFNEEVFGTEAPGFPISLERTECPICGKKTKPGGMGQHMIAKHGRSVTDER